LSVFDSRLRIDNWKLVKRQSGVDGPLDKSLASSYYQDCTELKLVYCSASNSETVDTNDPLYGSQWDTTLSCNSLNDYINVVQTECRGLFGADFNVNDYKNNYPRSFKNRVITTINTNSIFGKSYDRFSGDKEDTSKYSTNWQLWGVDNWEFQEPRSCDTKRATDIRYLVLRSFGCLTGYIDKTSEVCNATNLFNDDKDNTGGKSYDDTEPTMPKCPVDKDAKFPFGHKEVKVIQPGKPGGSGTQKPLTQGTQPTKKPVSPTTSGVNSLFSVTCVLFSSMFMFATGFLL